MRTVDRLMEVAADHGGYVTPELASLTGVSDARLRVLAREGALERHGHGLFRLPTFPVGPLDELHRAVLWPAGRGVVSHESAAALHELCDVNPRRVHLTVPYRPRRKGGQRYRVRVAELAPGEVDDVDGVPVTTVARTIRDLIADGTDPALVRQAIRTAARRATLDEVTAARLTVALADRADRPSAQMGRRTGRSQRPVSSAR